MPYTCQLSANQRVYLDNIGTQTIVTLSTQSPGQQQQSSSSVQTGAWTAAPEAFQMATGIVLKLKTAQGEQFIQIQGTSIGMLSSLSVSQEQHIPLEQTGDSPMQPMQPMQPMNMGDMHMNPMEMRMGNMSMQMGSSSPSNPRRFCSQCGSAVAPDDRFCAHCGHRLHSA